MNVENPNLPADRQGVGEPYKEYIEYLGYGVKEGYIDEGVALEILKNEEWEKVEEMMFKGEELANYKGD